jgi:Fe-S-cluster containining protein
MTELPEPTGEIACSNCIGACCRGPVEFQLTKDEYRRYGSNMTLREILKPRNYPQAASVPRVSVDDEGRQTLFSKQVTVPAGSGLWQMTGPCGYLADDYRCTIYETRPVACRTLVVGSDGCRNVRRYYGLDIVEITAKPEPPG